MRRPLVAAALAAALAAGGCAFGGDDDGGGSGGGATATVTPAPTKIETITGLGKGKQFDAQKLYASESPGVVTVVSVFENGAPNTAEGGVGSGFVLDGKGEIATNAHVVTTGEAPELVKASQVYVEFADGNQVEAEVRGYDPEADVALLKVDPEGLTLRPLPLGSMEHVAVGMPVAAIGSPFNERQSLSVGVVSAVDRSIRGLTAFQIAGAIQTDAAINPGNSGGPLVGPDGKVIGINQQIKSNTGGGEGVGFAVPIDVARRSLDQLRKNGKVTYAYLGVETVAIYPQLRERFDLPVAKGAWVQRVSSGAPAEAAGLRGGDEETVFQVRPYRTGGDVITRIDGHPIENPDDLSRVVAGLEPGQSVPVETWRDGERREVEVKLGDRPLSRPANAG
jgi:S1-C subfamily serine protease